MNVSLKPVSDLAKGDVVLLSGGAVLQPATFDHVEVHADPSGALRVLHLNDEQTVLIEHYATVAVLEAS